MTSGTIKITLPMGSCGIQQSYIYLGLGGLAASIVKSTQTLELGRTAVATLGQPVDLWTAHVAVPIHQQPAAVTNKRNIMLEVVRHKTMNPFLSFTIDFPVRNTHQHGNLLSNPVQTLNFVLELHRNFFIETQTRNQTAWFEILDCFFHARTLPMILKPMEDVVLGMLVELFY